MAQVGPFDSGWANFGSVILASCRTCCCRSVHVVFRRARRGGRARALAVGSVETTGVENEPLETGMDSLMSVGLTDHVEIAAGTDLAPPRASDRARP